MDSLQDLLNQYRPEQPPEIALIKGYIAEQFQASASIVVGDSAIIITVKSAALANALRLRTTALKAACETEKRLVFRIG